MKKVIRLIEKYSKLVHHHNKQLLSVRVYNDWSGSVLNDHGGAIGIFEFKSKKDLKRKLKAEIKRLKEC